MRTSPPYRVGRPGTIVSDNAEGLTLGGATGEDAVEHYGGNLIAESMSPDNAEFFSRAGNAHDPLVAALLRAKEAIRAFNGIGMTGEVEQACWNAYQSSPEMREINAALAIANGERDQVTSGSVT